DLWQRFGELLEGVKHDESARAYMANMAPEDAEIFARFVEGFYGAPLDDISIESIAGDASGLGGDDAEQRRVRGGYGRLADWLASRVARAGVAIRHGCIVHAIDWRANRVRVDFGQSSLAADRVIVTVPL